MFLVLERADDIRAAQKQLERTLRTELPLKRVRNIGYPGGTEFDAQVWSDGVYWYRPGYTEGAGATHIPRNLNWFGLLREQSLEITFECNTALEGAPQRLAGFFARDLDTGVVHLMHSGRVGGGTAGVSKAAFLAWSGAHLIDLLDAQGDVRRGVIVMPVAGPATTTALKRYLDVVAAFKAAVRRGDLRSQEFKRQLDEFKDYYPEPGGRRSGVRPREFDYVSRHGDVVAALRQWRIAHPLQKGWRIVKNVRTDLGVALRSELREVFEVKTSLRRPDLYCAIGQLLVHGNTESCRRTIVLPEGELPRDVSAGLRRMGIHTLRFRLDQTQATIL